MRPWGEDYYMCEHTEGIARGGTDPVPNCFKKAQTCVKSGKDGPGLRCLFGDSCENEACEICDAGFYCPDGENAITCPRNYFCSVGTVNPVHCPDGSSSKAGAVGESDCFDDLN